MRDNDLTQVFQIIWRLEETTEKNKRLSTMQRREAEQLQNPSQSDDVTW